MNRLDEHQPESSKLDQKCETTARGFNATKSLLAEEQTESNKADNLKAIMKHEETSPLRTETLLSKKRKEISQEDKPESAVKYGELVILGYNGSLPLGDRGRRRSKFVLHKRPKANGVKKSKQYLVKSTHSAQAFKDQKQHTISYRLSSNETILVEYDHDEKTDMFQIGRSAEPAIDFVVLDTIPGSKSGESKIHQRTVSRFACRILCNRDNPSEVRIYSACFDSSRNIFLGEKSTKWKEGDKIDAVTMNGILILDSAKPFCDGETEAGLWREVSVGGNVFSLKESRSSQQRGQAIPDEMNILHDGALIDLCGATLLWRSAEGLANSATKQDLEAFVDKLNAGKVRSSKGLNIMQIPRNLSQTMSDDKPKPYVYLTCGHVQGCEHSECSYCPTCLKVGPIAKLCMGIEPAFYLDAGPPTYAFNPCGHMATEKTIKYWANIGIPHGTNGFDAVCPFCATPIVDYPGYVRIIFRDDVNL